MEKGEEKTRLTLTDSDLTGRDVMTLISETNEIELFDHKYVEKLADEVWDGPYRVERSPLWLCSSAIALSTIFLSSDSLEDPFTIRDSFDPQHRNHPRWNKISAWSFHAWNEGTMVRHGTYAMISLLVSIYCLWYLATLNTDFNRIVTLQVFLFNGEIDPTLLDNRVTYECDPVP